MQLSKFSDYALRSLMFLALNNEKLCNIEEMATNLEISEHHLKKIINKLAKTDYIISIKGRNGGVKLGKSPSEINLGDILKITEENLNIVQCFKNNDCCPYFSENCKLKGIINSSLSHFFNEFSKYTLADII